MKEKVREFFPQSGISDRAIIRLWCWDWWNKRTEQYYSQSDYYSEGG